MARQPRWAEALVSLRNLLVAQLIQNIRRQPGAQRDMIGIFPVVERKRQTGSSPASTITATWIFQVVVEAVTARDARQVTATTLVKTHNWLLAAGIGSNPCHFSRLIVPALLRQVVR